MELVLELLQNFGFPIVVCGALYLEMQKNNERNNTFLNDITKKNEVLIETNSELVKSLNEKVDNIETKLDKVLEEEENK